MARGAMGKHWRMSVSPLLLMSGIRFVELMVLLMCLLHKRVLLLKWSLNLINVPGNLQRSLPCALATTAKVCQEPGLPVDWDMLSFNI